ncbi:hypothetical protein NPIL_457741, partial [Nephila pilipes]
RAYNLFFKTIKFEKKSVLLSQNSAMYLPLECFQKISDIILNEVGKIPEGCEGRTEAWFDSLTA